MSDLTGAYALTLLNPWAHMIAHYGKTIENRSWMPWESVDKLLIHAGKGWDKTATADRLPVGDLGDPDTAAVVAVADLAWACNASLRRDSLACGCDPDWAQPGQCHWQLANVVALPTPVPANGRQGLWRPTADLLAQVTEQYRAARVRAS